MCRAVACRTCGKTTWAGCGAHVDQVMRNVAQADRCRCAEKATAEPAGKAAGGGKGGGLFGFFKKAER